MFNQLLFSRHPGQAGNSIKGNENQLTEDGVKFKKKCSLGKENLYRFRV